ncbi:MAG: site-specific DNA-methyltransferase [Clostridiales bacterium]|nr:site-specific DNA-methyltransferase [Clostridiales bacterium]
MPTLDWIGKDKVVNHHLDVPYRVLERQYSYDAEGMHTEDNGSDNMIIHGDNLSALKSLLPQYEGRIKCIYIDPPYNTGNEGWVYSDSVSDPRIVKWLGEVVGKEGEDLSRHDKWLCMMYPRLKLLQRLLSDDGVIFISIDNNEKFNMKLICDEIFGANRFVSDIAVINNLKGRSDDKYIATAHESLLIYRNSDYITRGVPVPDEYVTEYKLSDELGKYRLQGLRKRGAGARREDRPNMFYPFYYDAKNGYLSVTRESDDMIEILPHLSDGSDGRWRWGMDTAKERITELTVQKVKGRGEYDVFQKDYLPDDGSKRVKPKSFWSGTEFSAETGTLQVKSILGKDVFETPKPVGIVEYCIEQAMDKDSIILDSFAGSGTTAHAVLNMNKADGGNRKFILIEMMDYADSITAERVKRVIDGYGSGKQAVEGTGGDFSYYELGETLMEHGRLNEEVCADKIREYVYFTETKQRLAPVSIEEPYLLGVHINTAYYFYYERAQITILNREFLHTVKTDSEAYVMYADLCTLSDAELEKYHITFKKIPRDILKL